jgi:hypothetical protein
MSRRSHGPRRLNPPHSNSHASAAGRGPPGVLSEPESRHDSRSDRRTSTRDSCATRPSDRRRDQGSPPFIWIQHCVDGRYPGARARHGHAHIRINLGVRDWVSERDGWDREDEFWHSGDEEERS